MKSKLGKFSVRLWWVFGKGRNFLRFDWLSQDIFRGLERCACSEFESIFPSASNEAVADIAEVEVPVSNLESGNMTILAATSELSKVNNLEGRCSRDHADSGSWAYEYCFSVQRHVQLQQDFCFYLVMDVELRPPIMLGYKDTWYFIPFSSCGYKPDVRNSMRKPCRSSGRPKQFRFCR